MVLHNKAVLSIVERIANNWVFQLKSGHGRIALTFDDGPDNSTTPLLLDSLKKYDIPATFFLTGEKCAENPAMLRLISDHGHVLANHGYHHNRHFYHDYSNQRVSIESTANIFSKNSINFSKLFRPPYGSFNFQTGQLLKSLEYKGILWSVMIKEWKRSETTKLWTQLKYKLHDGAIIVLHDGHKTTPNVISLLPLLADELSKRNWHFVKLTHDILQ
jgi:peptidoglycan/xylan/chitin deacetylase (PgdA/CDA1 family)